MSQTRILGNVKHNLSEFVIQLSETKWEEESKKKKKTTEINVSLYEGKILHIRKSTIELIL